MSKQSLLLVDGDTRSLRVLEVSLRKAGFMVTAALSVQDALDKLQLHVPDLIISETAFPDGDGFELRGRVRATADWSEIPFIFLTAEAAIENKIRGLELGVDDYLTKPIYIKEIVTRINILLQKRQRTRFEERRDGRTRFAGRVQDMPVVDVIQTIEISRKSGVIQFVGERGRQAAIYFRDGRVIDAEAGALQGEDAVYRLLTWSEGEFEVVFRTVRRREVISMSSQALLMEGMRRLDEWSRLFEQLPPLTHRFEVDTIELAARLGDVPDDNNRILRLVDGKRTLLEVIDASDVGDLECLQAISRLYFEELLIDLDHGKAPRRDTGKAIPLVEVETPTPVGEESSGPLSQPASALEDRPGDGAQLEIEEAFAPDSDNGGDGREPWGDEAESDLAVDTEDVDPVGPLMGGYRPSSLRLIDEAVAAAQAIEPSLFDEAPAPVAERAQGHGSNGVSGHAVDPADTIIVNDVTPPAGIAALAAAPRTGVAAAAAGSSGGEDGGPGLRAEEREDSGLRMIGSLGRDRAEASGELAEFGQRRPLRSETARELVTILPRRITREMPIVPQELAELPTPTPTASVLVPRSAGALEPASNGAATTQRIALPGTGVRAPGRSRKLFRIMRSVQRSGPGLGAMLLIVLAVLLAGTAVLLRLRRHPAPQSPSGEVWHDPAMAHERPAGASEVAVGVPAKAIEARSASIAGAGDHDAAAAVGSIAAPGGASDAGAAGTTDKAAGSGGGAQEEAAAHEAGSAEAEASADPTGDASPDSGSRGPHETPRAGARAGASTDRLTEARALCEQASAALDHGEAAQALELAAGSLRLRRTARAFVLRARAEQRLGRFDAALVSLDGATELAPTVGSVWEQRGRILWAARRRDEARVAFERFLELSPNSASAPEILRLLNEPR